VEGKNASAQNARKHGLLSEDILLPEENVEAFYELADLVHAAVSPEGGLETELTQRIIVLMWRLRRIPRLEKAILVWLRLHIEGMEEVYNDGSVDVLAEENLATGEVLAGESVPTNEVSADEDFATDEDLPTFDDLHSYRDSFHNARKIAKKSGLSDIASLGEAFSSSDNSLEKLSRYESSIERSYYKALHELERLQAARKGKHVPVPVAVDLNVTGLPTLR
jgi:hypothetical protein